jgi:hypothetical protein
MGKAGIHGLARLAWFAVTGLAFLARLASKQNADILTEKRFSALSVVFLSSRGANP